MADVLVYTKAYCPYCLASAGAIVVIFICVVIGYGIDILKSFGKKAAAEAAEK